MRKVFLATALVLMVAFAAFATESAPSNTVGFIKYQYESPAHGFPVGFTPFMLPFDYYQPGYVGTTSLDTIIGSQAADGDEVWAQTAGWIDFYFGGVWYGGDIMVNTDAYWYNHPDYAPGTYVNITTAGEVRTATTDYGPLPDGFTAYGIPVAGNTLYSSLELENVGLDYLELWDQLQGSIAFLYLGTWYDDLEILPGYAIWIYQATGSPSPNSWVYDPSDDPGRGTASAPSIHRTAPIQLQSSHRAVSTTPNTHRTVTPSRRAQ
jgi:hypothetical protein